MTNQADRREETPVDNMMTGALDEMPCDDCGMSIPTLFARIVGARPVRLVCRGCARTWLERHRIPGAS